MIISLDKNLYSREALLKAAFMCSDKMYIHLSQDKSCWIVNCESKTDETINPLEFENEIIRQELQLTILRQNADIRKIILARAMASTIVSDATGIDDTQGRSFDSQGILESWFDNEHDNKI